MDVRINDVTCDICGALESNGTILTTYIVDVDKGICKRMCELCYAKWRNEEYERQNVWSVVSEMPGDNKSRCIK